MCMCKHGIAWGKLSAQLYVDLEIETSLARGLARDLAYMHLDTLSNGCLLTT